MKITCVMVTGRQRGRLGLVGMAIDCFKRQTYPDRELLVLNHGTFRYADPANNVREVIVDKAPNIHVGMMRNYAFEHATGDWLMTWDDDDWYAPDRIEFQVKSMAEDRVVVLNQTMFCNLVSKESFVIEPPGGSKPTMMYPKKTERRFPNLPESSDVFFLMNCKRVIVDSKPDRYIRFFHGDNVMPARVFGAAKKGALNSEQAKLLESVVKQYNLD